MLRSDNADSGILSFFALPTSGAVLSVPWILSWVWFADLGGWPSNDDPFYAKTLALWVERGEWHWVRQYGALTASSAAHIFTGALTTAGNHFSYRSLFLICIVQQALGAVCLFWFARRMKLPLRFAFGLAATLVCFPLYFGHAFTFMTDGPAAAWAALGVTAGMWGVLNRNRRWLLVSSLAIGWGYWIRQTNGAIILAPLAALWLGHRFSTPRCFGQSSRWWLAASLLVPAAVAVGVFEWGGWLPGSVTRVEDVAPNFALDYWHKVAIGAYGWLLISGWFGLPWLIVFIAEARRGMGELSPKARLACNVGAVVVGVVVFCPLLATEGRACLTSATGNFIQNAHFGPIFTSDMDEPGRWGSLNGVVWPRWIWQTLSLLSLLTVMAMSWWGFWTISKAWGYVSRRHERPAIPGTNGSEFDDRPASANADEAMMAFGGFACVVVLAIGAAAIVLLIEPRMDRYGMFLLPMLSVWWILLAVLGKWRLTTSSALWAAAWLAGNLTMSVVFTHDMLAWNNARWSWVNSRLESGVEASQIDGGRDVNAWLRLDEDVNTFARPGDTSDWWSGFATWAIAVGPRPGWETAERLPWPSWATGQTHELLVLKRSPQTSPGHPPLESSSQEAHP